MRAPVSPVRSVPIRAAAVLVAVLMLGSCGGSTGNSAQPSPTPCPSVTPGAVDESLIPKDVPIELLGDLVATKVKNGFLTVDSFTTTQIIELDPQFQRDLLANGYQIVSHDNEGFEAEIFFAKHGGTTGVFSLHDYPCRKGTVRLKLVYGSKELQRR